MAERGDVEALAARLSAAWNAADGAAFAAEFADDADFVTVTGLHARGRDEIAANHQRIFETIYRGSRNRFTLQGLRALSDDLSLAHVGSDLDVTEGAMAGRHQSLMSVVLDERSQPPRIVALHNSFVRPMPGSTS